MVSQRSHRKCQGIFRIQSKVWRGLRVNSTCYFGRGLGFHSGHPYGDSQPSGTPAPVGVWCPLLAFMNTHVYTQANTHTRECLKKVFCKNRIKLGLLLPRHCSTRYGIQSPGNQCYQESSASPLSSRELHWHLSFFWIPSGNNRHTWACQCVGGITHHSLLETHDAIEKESDCGTPQILPRCLCDSYVTEVISHFCVLQANDSTSNNSYKFKFTVSKIPFRPGAVPVTSPSAGTGTASLSFSIPFNIPNLSACLFFLTNYDICLVCLLIK